MATCWSRRSCGSSDERPVATVIVFHAPPVPVDRFTGVLPSTETLYVAPVATALIEMLGMLWTRNVAVPVGNTRTIVLIPSSVQVLHSPVLAPT